MGDGITLFFTQICSEVRAWQAPAALAPLQAASSSSSSSNIHQQAAAAHAHTINIFIGNSESRNKIEARALS
jgi:hypothetical protein